MKTVIKTVGLLCKYLNKYKTALLLSKYNKNNTDKPNSVTLRT